MVRVFLQVKAHCGKFQSCRLQMVLSKKERRNCGVSTMELYELLCVHIQSSLYPAGMKCEFGLFNSSMLDI